LRLEGPYANASTRPTVRHPRHPFEDIRIGPQEAAEHESTTWKIFGVEKIVTLRVDEHCLRATAPAALELPIDSAVRFSWNCRSCTSFDRETGVNLTVA
jgi:multiple sugar transport system ATP-binding protein